MMKASVFIAYILLLMYFVVGVAFIYLFVLLVRALKKYIKSEPVRKEKAESAKSLGEVIKRYRTQRKMTQEFVAESLECFKTNLYQNGKVVHRIQVQRI